MSQPNLSALTVGKPAAWLMALPTVTANVVCGVAYVLTAVCLHSLFALPNALWVTGSAASGVAVAAALLCGRRVLPGLYLARLLWELCQVEGPVTTSDLALAAIGATALVLQTEVARMTVLALHILPSKLRRLRKSLQICGTGLLAAGVGTGLYLLAVSQLPHAAAVNDWSLQAAGLLLPEWAGIAILLPLAILWLQDDAWREPRKWQVTMLIVLATALTLGLTARALWSDELQALSRLHDSNTALTQGLADDLAGAAQAVQILQSHVRTRPQESPAQFNEVATAILRSYPHLQALSWNPLVPHAGRPAFESRLRAAYGPQAALVDRAADGQLIPSRPSDVYIAVEHIAPLESNRLALGLNIHAHPARRAALQQVMRSGQPAVTPRIQLVQETGKSWGALYLSPLYRTPPQAGTASAPEGFTVAVLRMEDIAGQAVERLRPAKALHSSKDRLRHHVVHYQFLDLNEAADAQILFADDVPARPAPRNLLHSKRLLSLDLPPSETRALDFGGRQYALRATPGGDFWQDELSRTPFLALGTGVMLTWVALAISLMLTGSTQLLTIAVERRTQQLQQADSALQATNLRLQRQSVQLRSVLEAMDQGYLGFDADGVLVLANDKSFDLIALPPGEERESYLTVARHIGRHFQLAQAQALSVAQSMLTVRNNKEHHVYRDLVPVKPDAVARYLDMRVHTFEDPGLRTIVLLHDTTPAMQLERSKSQFMSFAAHEIRTPLTVIHGYADLLATRTPNADSVKEMGQQILRKSLALNQLLQRMLDLSELDMNGLDIKRTRITDLGALCSMAARNILLPEGREPPVVQHQDPIPWCRVDPVAITMALTELLHNAYAFSPAGTPVTMGVGPLNDDTGQPGGVRIRISDQGQGMTHDVQQHIFERFYRADSSGKHPGFGLGLSTAKLIADLHKAQLHIESTPQQGTVVTIDIPQGDM
nr:CHASE domain-containing protein [uncultured Rhodoferax sp.]